MLEVRKLRFPRRERELNGCSILPGTYKLLPTLVDNNTCKEVALIVREKRVNLSFLDS